MTSAVFLDRDGVINKDKGYFHDANNLEILPGVIEGLKKMQKQGHKLIVVSNQAGIGKRIFQEKEMHEVNKKINFLFRAKGIEIKEFIFCPHRSDEKCLCRKPHPKMILDAAKKHKINLNQSFLIGDKTSDLLAGINVKKAGFEKFETILVETGYAGKDKKYNVTPDHSVKDLVDAAQKIQKQHINKVPRDNYS